MSVLKLAATKDNIRQYERPYPINKLSKHLVYDPVHRWRATTGIELIHEEPTYGEFRRIVKNWELMTPEQKKRSDAKSMELFDVDNLTHSQKLKLRMFFKRFFGNRRNHEQN